MMITNFELTMSRVRLFLFVFVAICISEHCQGQGPIGWTFRADRASRNIATLYIEARLGPGWHLYSQFIGEGGPIPTQFSFNTRDHYDLLGKMTERGDPHKFFDDIYNMEIIWYSGVVLFTQRIRIHDPVNSIEGKVEFMTCNDHVCIPGEQTFNIDFPK